MHYIVFKSGECQFPEIVLGMLYTKKKTASIVLCDGLSIVLRHERRLKKTNKQILKCRLCKPLCVINVPLIGYHSWIVAAESLVTSYLVNPMYIHWYIHYKFNQTGGMNNEMAFCGLVS